LLFIVALEYTIGRFLVKEDGLKLNGTHQLLVYADDDDTILDRNVHTIKKNTEVLVVVSKEIFLEVSLTELSTRNYLEIRMRNEVTI
jgi:hypothetical protein